MQRGRRSSFESSSFRGRVVSVLAVAVVICTAYVGCASSPDRVAFNTISGARETVQAAVVAYKTHCGVKAHEPGPGSCPVAEYEKARDAYEKFQTAHALAVHGAAGISEKNWFALIKDVALDSLKIIEAWR